MLKKMCNKCNSINLFQKSIDTTRKSDKEESVDLSEIPLRVKNVNSKQTID